VSLVEAAERLGEMLRSDNLEWLSQFLGFFSPSALTAARRPGPLEAGLEYVRRRFAPNQFTLSVASSNGRAITVYERAGFAPVRVFTHWTNGGKWEFIEM
jgi:hypothetical protein